MTQQDYTHPITPPPELVQQWDDEGTEMFRPQYQQHLTARAAQWGADQELEACCEYVYERLKVTTAACIVQELRFARRPKPPSLKEQALEWLIAAEELHKVSGIDPKGTIRRALEQLSDH